MAVPTLPRRRFLGLASAGLLAGASGTASGSQAGEYIVGTRSLASVREVRAVADRVKGVLDFGPHGLAVAGWFPPRAIRAIERRLPVDYVEPDVRTRAVDLSDLDAVTPGVGWGVDRVDAEKVHGENRGAGVRVALLDTGIDHDHPALGTSVKGGISYTAGSWWGGAPSTAPADWDDRNGHGTHCAGIVAAGGPGAEVTGVAPGASLYAVKVLDDEGWGVWSDMAAGIRWAADNGMDVASMSFLTTRSRTLERACAYAAGKGVVLVAAAGNSGPDTADDNYPGASRHTISVAATELVRDEHGGRHDSLAGFSSTGPAVDIGAPGRAIRSTVADGEYATYSGTSMACPHVSGAAALLVGVGATGPEARSVLLETAEWPVYDHEAGRPLTRAEVGVGLLDAAAAFERLRADAADAPLAARTDAVSTVGTTAVTLHGTLRALGGNAAVTCRFEYRRASSSRWVTVGGTTRDRPGPFEATVRGLDDGERYEYRAVVTAGGTTATGARVPFVTTDDPAVVTTGEASYVSETGATLSGTVEGLGGAAGADAGFAYRPVGAARWRRTPRVGVGVHPYQQTVTGLTPGTDYEFRATATATDGDETTGAVARFETDGGGPDAAAPTGRIDRVRPLRPGNAHAEYAVDWAARDDAGLTSVAVELRRGGRVVDRARRNVRGTGATGRTEVSERLGAWAGRGHEVRLVVTDLVGNRIRTDWVPV